ncbi:hypothetical protein [Actinophytocola sp.]|uniref:hypothetical protein n=1 Tax=Actinophytocola sp. TaxID=1872138 RepID=UPI003899C92D
MISRPADESHARRSVADGYLCVTANQLHRQAKYQRGKDLRRKPYRLFRVPVDAGPVRLR